MAFSLIGTDPRYGPPKKNPNDPSGLSLPKAPAPVQAPPTQNPLLQNAANIATTGNPKGIANMPTAGQTITTKGGNTMKWTTDGSGGGKWIQQPGAQIGTAVSMTRNPATGAMESMQPGTSTNFPTGTNPSTPQIDSSTGNAVPANSNGSPFDISSIKYGDSNFWQLTPQQQRQKTLEAMGAGEEAKKIAAMTDIEYVKYTSEQAAGYNQTGKDVTALNKKISDAQMQEQAMQSNRSIKGMESQMAQSPEGAAFSTNKDIVAGAKATMNQRQQNANTAAQASQMQVDMLQKQRDQALAEGDVTKAQGLAVQADQASHQAYLDKQDAARIEQEGQANAIDLIGKFQSSGLLKNMTPEQIQQLAPMLSTLPEGVSQALLGAAYQQDKNSAAATKSTAQQGVLKDLSAQIKDGFQPTLAYMQQLSQSSGIPMDMLTSFVDSSQAIMNDKSLDSATAETKLQDAQFDLNQKLNGITTEESKKIADIDKRTQDMVASGMPLDQVKAERQNLFSMYGLKSIDDPQYQADLQGKQLSNQTIAIGNQYLSAEKSAALKQSAATLQTTLTNNQYLPAEKQAKLLGDYYDNAIKEVTAANAPATAIANLQKLKADAIKSQAESNKIMGITSTINMPTGSKLSVTQGENGIKVGLGNGEKGGQCGRFVNDFVGISGWMGDTIASKLARTQEGRTPQAGDIFVQEIPGSSTGHTGVVESVNPDGTVNLVESNYHDKSAPETVSRRTVSADGLHFGANPNSKSVGGSSNGLDQSIVEGLAGYTMDVKDLSSRLGKDTTESERAKYMSAAAEYAKSKGYTYDSKQFPANQKFLNNWQDSTMTSRGGQNDTFNRALGHIGELNSLAKSFNNGNFQGINDITQWAKENTGDPNVSTYNNVKSLVAGEVAKMVAGGVPGVTEVERLNNSLNDKLTPAQFQQTITSLARLMGENLKVNVQDYKNHLGKLPDNPVMFDEAQKTIKDLGLDPASYDLTLQVPPAKYEDLTPTQQAKFSKYSGATYTPPSQDDPFSLPYTGDPNELSNDPFFN